MLTRKALKVLLQNIYHELIALGLKPERMVLFGSYATGQPHENSDVDIAIWHQAFSGDHMLDFEKIRPVYRKFKGIDIKTFPSKAGADADPFIGVINQTGIECQFDDAEIHMVP